MCGLCIPVNMKDMGVWRAKDISIHHNVASSHAIVRFSIPSFFKRFTELIYPIQVYALYLSCGKRIEPEYNCLSCWYGSTSTQYLYALKGMVGLSFLIEQVTEYRLMLMEIPK